MDNVKRQMAQVNLEYLGGHPELPHKRSVGVERDGDHINLCAGLKPLVQVPITDIRGVSLERASSRSAGKAAAGAIIGGVLTGGIGAIAGAALGGRKHDESVIVMTVQYGPAEVQVLFGGKNVQTLYPQFTRLLK